MEYNPSKEEIRLTGILTNRDFVEVMYEDFGLTSRPEYPEIEIVEMFSDGGAYYNPDTIMLKDFFSNKSHLIKTICHESAHLLIPNTRKEFQRRGRNLLPRNRYLYEITSDLAGIIYFSKAYNSPENFLDKKPNYSQKLAWDIFKSNPKLLMPMSNLDMREARKLFLPSLKRPLYNSSRNPYEVLD